MDTMGSCLLHIEPGKTYYYTCLWSQQVVIELGKLLYGLAVLSECK